MCHSFDSAIFCFFFFVMRPSTRQQKPNLSILNVNMDGFSFPTKTDIFFIHIVVTFSLTLSFSFTNNISSRKPCAEKSAVNIEERDSVNMCCSFVCVTTIIYNVCEANRIFFRCGFVRYFCFSLSLSSSLFLSFPRPPNSIRPQKQY